MTTPYRGWGQYQLNAVSCTSRSFCVAAGFLDKFTLADEWNGSSWSTMTTTQPGVPGAGEGLNGISCTTSAFCIATGNFAGAPAGQDLAQIWNGSTWSTSTTTDPGGTENGNVLNSVSCTSRNFCVAAGTSLYGTPANQTLAEIWNGSAWSTSAATDPGGGNENGIADVSCPSRNFCVAVGSYSNGTALQTLVELGQR